MHISGTFEKMDIESTKVNIENAETDMEKENIGLYANKEYIKMPNVLFLKTACTIYYKYRYSFLR